MICNDVYDIYIYIYIPNIWNIKNVLLSEYYIAHKQYTYYMLLLLLSLNIINHYVDYTSLKVNKLVKLLYSCIDSTRLILGMC